jgi:glycosyltransferase involved in cell wall biosynthesis
MSASDMADRIVFCSNDIVYLHRFRGRLIQHLVACGYEVTAVCPINEPAYVKLVEGLGATLIEWRLKKSGIGLFRELGAFFALIRILRDIKPSVFFGYTVKPVIYGLIAAAIARVPRRVGMITGLGYAFLPGAGMHRKLVSGLVRVGYRIALSQAQALIFQNRDDIAEFRDANLIKAKCEVYKVNGSGVDTLHFAPAPFPDAPQFVFLFVGRLLRDKGIYEFVDAARIVRAQMPETRFVIVGAADTNPAAVPECDLLKWRAEGIVELKGHTQDPQQAYKECHAFVLPSYREGTPRTALEAMSSARAIITTDVPGCRETVRHKVNGLLVPARDSSALADAMLSLAKEPATAREMGRLGRDDCVRRFEAEAVSTETVSIILGKQNLAGGFDQ